MFDFEGIHIRFSNRPTLAGGTSGSFLARDSGYGSRHNGGSDR